jgi:hypothetical protein
MAQRMPFIIAELGTYVDPFFLYCMPRLLNGTTPHFREHARRPRLSQTSWHQARQWTNTALAGRDVEAGDADRIAIGVLPMIQSIPAAGARSRGAITQTLNK